MSFYARYPVTGINGFGSIQLLGSTSGALTLTVPATVTSYTLTFPAAQGGVNTLLQNNGSGILSWVTAPSIALTSAHILVGNVSNVATDVAVSGDLTLANTGAFTVAKIQTVTVSGTSGTGNVVFSSSPTLVGPDLGTPTALVGTNITGTAAGLTAGAVTTNANLTGPIASSGNATSITAQTGTGTTFVMNTGPTVSALTTTGTTTMGGTVNIGGATRGVLSVITSLGVSGSPLLALIDNRTSGVDWRISSGANNAGEINIVNNSAGTIPLSIEGGGTLIYGTSGNEVTGAGSALLGANSPAVTNTAPFKWLKVKLSDGSTVYMPCWK